MNKNKKYVPLIIVSIILMVINIVLSIIFRGASGANIFTTISGWISGIATIILGSITLWVNAQYKKENDVYLEKQNELLWKNELKDSIELYRNQVLNIYKSFLQLNFTDLLYQLARKEDKPEAPMFELALLSKIQCEQHNMFFVFSICRYYFNFKSELFDAYINYLSLLSKMVDEHKEMVYNREFDKGEELQKAYINVLNNFNIHIASINVFLSAQLQSESKKELKSTLSEMREKQTKWWADVKPKTYDNSL